MVSRIILVWYRSTSKIIAGHNGSTMVRRCNRIDHACSRIITGEEHAGMEARRAGDLRVGDKLHIPHPGDSPIASLTSMWYSPQLIVIVIIPLLISPRIIAILNPIIKPLNIAHLSPSPPSDIVRDILDIVNSVVKPILNAILGPVIVILDILRYTLYLAHLPARPVRRVVGEVFHVLLGAVGVVVDAVLQAVFVLVPMLLCWVALAQKVHAKY
jgi:hypothetical protein